MIGECEKGEETTREDFGNNNWTVMKPVGRRSVSQSRCQIPFSLKRDKHACALHERPNQEERQCGPSVVNYLSPDFGAQKSIFGCCTADSQADKDRNQLNNNMGIYFGAPKSGDS